MPEEETLRAQASNEIHLSLEDTDRPRSMQALLEPRKEPIRVPLHKLRRTLDDLERQHAEKKNRRRQEPFHQTVTESLTSRETVMAREPIGIPRDDARRMLDDLKRRRAQGQARQRQETPRQNTVIVLEDELARKIAAITQQRADERLGRFASTPTTMQR
ncbi:hypothetical protein NPX13_g8674 [Xylaria arbuscula]|uniref:Uncharacterized protein n=1 Tax=Xylaria arbuscula TaxID=114810 RepID=A0A9W8TJL5_9PEZI|nr:hypothetical protein NPX13_g8674 [Xylaria arbuscula]